MNSNVLLDVAELALTHLDRSSSVTYANIDSLYDEYISGGGLCRIPITKNQFRSALKIMFPIYKNKRKHTQEFKISSRAAYSVCEDLSIKLRPLNHIVKDK